MKRWHYCVIVQAICILSYQAFAQTTYYSRTNGDWSDATSWSTVSLGGASASTVPASSAIVIIGNDNTITVSSNNTMVSGVEIRENGILKIANGTIEHNLGTVNGKGTLQIITNDTDVTDFPGGNFAGFLGTSGGKVVYHGSGSYTIPVSPSSFYDLTISGSGTVTLPNTDLSIVDDFSIEGGMTVLISNSTSGNLDIGDSLDITASSTLRLRAGTDRTITVGTDIVVNGTFHASGGGNGTHQLSLAGNLVNHGTFDMADAATHYCVVTFNTSLDASISGAGSTTDFYRLVVDKGTSASSQLEITSDNFSLSGPTHTDDKALTLQNGTLVLGAAHTLTLSTGGASFSIPATAGLQLDHASAVVEITSASSDLSLAGLLHLSNGAINIGDDLSGTDANAIYYTTGGAAITVEGGTLTVGGAIRPVPDAATLTYTQSGGKVIIANNRGTTEFWNSGGHESTADFSMHTASGSAFNMSGGLLEIVRRNATADGKALWINKGVSHSISGGTVSIVTDRTTGSHDIGISTAVPLWNVEIGQAGSSFTGRVGASVTEYDLQVLNNFTLNLSNNFNLHRANNNSPSGNDWYDLYVGGDFTVESGTIGFPRPEDAEGTIVFNGLGNQTINDNDDGVIAFYSWEINKPSGTLQIASGTDISVEKDFTYTGGTLNQNGQTITFNGSINQTIAGSPLTLDDITIDNNTGVTLIASRLTIEGDLALNAGVLQLGTNQLILGEAATVSTTGSWGLSTMIRIDGSESAAGVEKQFSATGGSFNFPIGTDVYSPVIIDVTDADGAAGAININPINSREPTAPLDSALNYFWIVETTGFGVGLAIDHEYRYDQTDVAITPPEDEADYRDTYFNGVTWTEGLITQVDTLNNTISLSTAGGLGAYHFTAGHGLSNPEVYYSRTSGDWHQASTWSTDPSGSPIATTAPGADNPVVIQNGHTLTIDTTGAGGIYDFSAISTSLESTGKLDITMSDQSLYSIGTVDGEGTIRFTVSSTPTLPPLSGRFINDGGGTVELAYTADGALPVGQLVYHHLILSGTQQYNLDADITVHGDLTVTTSQGLKDNGFSTAGTSAGTFTLASGVQLTVEGANSFPACFGTYHLPSSSTVRYDSDQAQTVASLGSDSYWDLQLSGSGTKTLGGNIILADDLTINSGAVLSASTYDIRIRGDWNRDGRSNSAFKPGTGTVTFDGSTAQEIDITYQSDAENFAHVVIQNPSGVSLDNATYEVSHLDITGNLTITSGSLDLQNKTLTLGGNLNDNGTLASGGTVTLSGALAQTIGSDQSFDKLVINNANGVTIADDVTITIANDLTISSGTLNTGSGTATVIFNGVGEQHIHGSVTFNNLVKQAGDTLHLNGSVTVNGTLTLTGGIINTNVSDMLTIGRNGNISGGSASSYINGPLQHTENSTTADTKLFPFGSENVYRPITLNLIQADAVTRTYLSSLHESAPPARTLPTGANELIRVSGARYYSISQLPEAAVTSATITLDYHPDDEVDDGTTLRIAKSDGASHWENIGGIGSTSGTEPGDFVAGTITSGSFTTFSDFVLASSSESMNPLPIRLLTFSAKANKHGALLTWTTAWEEDNDYFVVERAADAKHFKPLGKVAGAGHSTTGQAYQFVDTNPLTGTAYYRLRQVDYDGTFTHSRIIPLSFSREGGYIAQLVPNPANGRDTKLLIERLAAYERVKVSLLRSYGKSLVSISLQADAQGRISQSLKRIKDLPTGVYLVTITAKRCNTTLSLILP